MSTEKAACGCSEVILRVSELWMTRNLLFGVLGNLFLDQEGLWTKAQSISEHNKPMLNSKLFICIILNLIIRGI